MIKERIIRYKSESIHILFHVDRCTHYAACLKGAPEVFDSTRRPWIEMEKADPEKVARVIMTCPTGALHFKRLDGGAEELPPPQNTIIIETHGPVYIHGEIELRDHDGKLLLKDTRVALCRCGLSRIKPLCDDTHARIGFEDSDELETKSVDTSREPDKGKVTVMLEQDGALRISGPVTVKCENGDELFKGNRTALCRCGHSQKMPFCDGSHRKSDFKSDEGCIKIIG